MNDAMNIYKLYLENAEQQKSPTLFVDDKGTRRWKLHGELHRTDGPAIECANGSKSWWVHGELHRPSGPAIIELARGYKAWYEHGERHRLDGPAIEYADGDKEWHIKGKRYNDVTEWAIAALEWEGKEPTDEMIEQKMQQVMQADLFD